MLSLQHLGYQVQVAASGPEALELYRTNEKGFDLVILDMLMPQLPGEKVFVRLKELDAAVRVLLISGFASQEAVRSVLSSGGLGFIQKPFTIEDLAVRVRKCLAL
jgi:DNA-binding response OmpR family regulator